MARFRINCFFQRNAMSAAFRLIPSDIKSIEDLGLPRVMHEFVNKPRGLVLVTGPTGSGKSTTLASMIDQINRDTRRATSSRSRTRSSSFTSHKRCIVNQREVGADARLVRQRACAPRSARIPT